MILIAILMALLAQTASADNWLAPNEQFPVVGNCIYDRVQPGRAYVSVGSERGFMGAAKTKSGALYVVDIDPDVIQFAEINRALIAASANSAEYRHLRLKASQSEWNAAAWKFTQPADKPYKDALSKSGAWSWWDKEVRQNQGWGGGFQLLAAQPSAQPDPQKDAFSGFNYLWDETLFQNLKTLASAHTIWASNADLTNEQQMGSIIDWIQSHSLKLGVIDTSNVPDNSDEGHAGTAASGKYMALFAAHSEPDTVFLNTVMTANSYAMDDGWWTYYGFTADEFINQTSDQVAGKIESEFQEIWPLTQQHEYECRFNQQTDGNIWMGI